MARRSPIVVLLLAATLACCADNEAVFPPGSGDTAIVVFQDGVSPDASYNGTRDAVLKNGPTNDFRNRCYGNVPFDTVGAALLAGAPYERRLVVKADVSSITDCASVLSSSLAIAFEGAPPDSLALDMHRILVPSYAASWVEGQDGIQSGVSWLTTDGSEPWTAEGGDIEAEPFARAKIAGDTIVVFSIPPVLTRNWIATPASNHGVLVRCAAPSSAGFATVHLRETFSAALRPRFAVAYLKGG